MKVGFIGLGNVGAKLAGSLLRNGVDLTVRDLNPEFVAACAFDRIAPSHQPEDQRADPHCERRFGRQHDAEADRHGRQREAALGRHARDLDRGRREGGDDHRDDRRRRQRGDALGDDLAADLLHLRSAVSADIGGRGKRVGFLEMGGRAVCVHVGLRVSCFIDDLSIRPFDRTLTWTGKLTQRQAL